MLLLDSIAEQRIAEAIDRGELSDLPGAGRPLHLDDDALVPEDLRMAFRILKNAGFVPPEVEALRGIGELERFIETLADGELRSAAMRKLQLLRERVERSGLSARGLQPGQPYLERVLKRLAG
jgi:hypothetical protein